MAATYTENTVQTKELTLEIVGGGGLITFPVPVTQTLGDLKSFIHGPLGVSPEKTIGYFTPKAGGVGQDLIEDDDAILPDKIMVSGINSFERSRHVYSHPFCILGAGHIGLRMALFFKAEKVHDYVQIDKLDRIGGLSWNVHANKTTRVQTELGVYHLDYGVRDDKFTTKGMSCWPHSGDLLDHFEKIARAYELYPQIKLNTEVRKFDIINKDGPSGSRSYNLDLLETDEDEIEESKMMVASIAFFPGTLTIPRKETFAGEENFGGPITIGLQKDTDYTVVKGKDVAIIGFGAFSVENVRTCVEHHAKKVYLVARRKNLMMPRCISWWINGSISPITAHDVLRAMAAPYAMIGEDPWDGSYYSVEKNADCTRANIHQKSRFGIGDIYFLARYYGRLELVVGWIKEFVKDGIQMQDGSSQDFVEVQSVIKVLGFNQDYSIDTLMQLTELTGFWCDGDNQRGVVAEFPTMNAGAFGGTSLSPFAISISYMMIHMLLYPADFDGMLNSGMCPKHKADDQYPAFALAAKDGSYAMMIVGTLTPLMGEKMSKYTDQFKRERHWGTRSLEDVVAEATMEWNRYCQQWYDEGDTRPFPPYLYPVEDLTRMVKEQDDLAMEKYQKMMAKQAAKK